MSRPYFFFSFLDFIHFSNTITLLPLYVLTKITKSTYIVIVDVKSRRFMYQNGRARDEVKKHKSPAVRGIVGISAVQFQ